MEFNFKKFEGRNKRVEDRITVTRSRGIGFPTKFFEDNGLKDYKFVNLYWDAEKKAIGIQFANENPDNDAFTLLKSKAGYGGSIIASSFFRNNGIDVRRYYGRYVWEKIDYPEVGVLYTVTLKERQNAT